MSLAQTLPFSPENELDNLYTFNRISVQSENWKAMLDATIPVLRSCFIFDNLAVYLVDAEGKQLEAAFARVIGRGRSAGGEISWGEAVSGRVFIQNKPVIQKPDLQNPPTERLEMPYILGVPIQRQGKAIGALTFARFGGPDYSPDNARLASFVADLLSANLAQQTDAELRQQLENERLQAQLQDDFVSTITHELRTPLGFIKGYATTLLRTDMVWDADTQKEFLTIIEKESDRLEELIDNLLDSARLQSGAMPMVFQPVRVDVLIKDAITRSRTNHESMQIKLHIAETLPPVEGDPKRLGQVIDNLITNATKYAPDSPLNISILPEENEIHLVFQDGGPGIPPHHLTHLFERFYRAPDQAPNIRGTGLGLYICRQIVQQHHGNITVESTVGEGTTFHVFLPYRQNPSQRQPTMGM